MGVGYDGTIKRMNKHPSASLVDSFVIFPHYRTDISNEKSRNVSKESSSRAFKFRENMESNNNQGQMYSYKGQVLHVSALTFSLLTTISCSGLRQESLIDMDGPEEDEDMIYECPGLAPHGEMEVTNPFFLQREFNLHTDTETEAEAEVDADVSEAATPAQAATSAPPCPVNTSTTISHGTIARTQH